VNCSLSKFATAILDIALSQFVPTYEPSTYKCLYSIDVETSIFTRAVDLLGRSYSANWSIYLVSKGIDKTAPQLPTLSSIQYYGEIAGAIGTDTLLGLVVSTFG
jgi:hypothetical protein